jgi:hypothetical protein
MNYSAMNKLKHFIEVVTLLLLKRKANKLAQKNKVQYFIVKFRGKPELLTKDGFQYLRQHGFFSRKFTANELKKIALYYTSTPK